MNRAGGLVLGLLGTGAAFALLPRPEHTAIMRARAKAEGAAS